MNAPVANTVEVHPVDRPCSPKSYRLALWAVIVFSLICHIRQYAADRSFWHDEASLVLNIRGKTAGQLLQKLDYEQAAPPLFLLAERGVYRLLGGSEFSLRALPFACGIASIFLMLAIARRVLQPPWDLLAVLLLGVSDMLVWHATEAKQYGTDVFSALLLTWLAIRCIPPEKSTAARRESFGRFIVFFATATIAMWFSYPAVLIFAALSVALLPTVLRSGRRGIFAWIIGNAIVGVSFLALLILIVHKQQDANLANYWQEDFLDLRHPLAWLCSRLLGLCNYPVFVSGPLILAAGILGAWALNQNRQFQLLTILAGPVFIAIAAAAARCYPFDGARLTAFLSPDVLLLAALGMQFFVQAGWQRLRYATWLPPVFVAGAAVAWAMVHLAFPHTRGHLRPVAAYVANHVKPTDGIYALEEREWICYWPVDDPRMRPELDRADEIPFDRFWIIWSFSSDRSLHRLDPRLAWLSSFSDRRDTYINKAGGAAFLFQRRPGALPAELDPPNIDTNHKMMRPQRRNGPGAKHAD